MDFDRVTNSSVAIPKSLIAIRSGSEIEFHFSYYNLKTIIFTPRTEESFGSKLPIACLSAVVYRVTLNGKRGVSERIKAKTPMNCPMVLCA